MNILHVIRDLSPETGGPVSAIHGLSAAQRKSGHEVRIISTDYGFSRAAGMEGAMAFRCLMDAWRYAPGLKKMLDESTQWADVIHIHMMWEYPTLMAAKMASKHKKPFLLRPCGMLDEWSMGQGALKKKAYLGLFSKDIFSDYCTLHFTTQAEKMKSRYPSQLDSVVIENGIDIAAFSKENCRDNFLDHFPALRDKDMVLFLGRVHPKKQPEVALEAFAKVASDFPGSCLLFAGPCDPAYQEKLAKLAMNLNVHDRVFFSGILRGKVLFGAYRASRVFILPSLQENFGIAVVEAMANYSPVIISEQVDIKDYIISGDAGLVRKAIASEFSSAIKTLLVMPKRGEEMGRNGRAVAEKYFSWDITAGRLDEAYKRIVSKLPATQ